MIKHRKQHILFFHFLRTEHRLQCVFFFFVMQVHVVIIRNAHQHFQLQFPGKLKSYLSPTHSEIIPCKDTGNENDFS